MLRMFMGALHPQRSKAGVSLSGEGRGTSVFGPSEPLRYLLFCQCLKVHGLLVDLVGGTLYAYKMISISQRNKHRTYFLLAKDCICAFFFVHCLSNCNLFLGLTFSGRCSPYALTFAANVNGAFRFQSLSFVCWSYVPL